MNIKLYFLCIIIICNVTEKVTAQEQGGNGKDIGLKVYSEKIDFIENQGQWDEDITYQAELSKTQIRFLKNKISFGALTKMDIPKHPNLDSIEKESKTKEAFFLNREKALNEYQKQKGFIEGFVWNMRFEGASSKSKLLGKNEKDTRYNYYLGRVKAEGIQSMGEVWYQNIYPNTDVRFYSATEGLEYDIILHPKAKVENIKIELEGIETMRLDEKGNLIYETPWGDMTKEAPYAYQMIDGQEVAVATKYRLDGNYLSFDILEAYNPKKALIIDPLILKWSTYLGGIGDESYFDAEEYNGEIYLKGGVASVDFPTTVGSFQQNFAGGNRDLAFTRLDGDGNVLISTYIGGSAYDRDGSYVFQDGTWYLSGTTESTDFPLTAGAYQATKGGDEDKLILEVNSNLLLEYSSYIGGATYDYISIGSKGISNDRIYFEGTIGDPTGILFTNSSLLNNQTSSVECILSYNVLSHQIENFTALPAGFSIENLAMSGTDVFAIGDITNEPTSFATLGAYQSTYGGGYKDVYIVKLDANLNPLLATYIGGDDYEEVEYFEIKDGFLYLLGITSSSNFPTTMGAFQTTYGGGFRDLFAVKMDALGNVFYSTYIGGADTDGLSTFADNRGLVDAGNFYILGETESSDFPTTAGAFQTSLSGSENNFALKLNSSGQADWSTYFSGGGTQGLLDYTILDNELLILGFSTSFFFPTTVGAYQTSRGGSFDRTFSRLDLMTGYPTYSTYIGGSDQEFGGDDKMHVEGTTIFITGETRSIDFPITPGASQSAFGGRIDLSIVKIKRDNTVDFAIYLGGNGFEGNSDYEIKFQNNKIHILGETDLSTFNSVISSTNTFPTTTTAFQNIHRGTAQEDLFYTQIDQTTGATLYSTLIGGSAQEGGIFSGTYFFPSGEDVYIFGSTESIDFPVTQGAFQSSNGGGRDVFVLKLSTCVDSIQADTIRPLSQTVCTEATVEPLIGGDAMAAFPIVLRNNTVDTHVPGSPSFAYIWQDSVAGGTWNTISGATGRDFLPPELTITTYYRRAVLNTCGAIIGYSNETVINVISTQAPVVDGGANLLICAGGSIQIGAPTTGGTPTYTYSWTPTLGLNDPTIEQPIATVVGSTVYTVEVTDANGCVHKDQALVNVITASAGSDVFACQGAGVRIGSPAPAGASSLTYAWSPTTGLSDPSVAQPIANPISTTTYTVTVTGANGCPLVDAVEVTPVTLPTAGGNATVCSGSNMLLGQPNLAGYTYDWSPGLYLNNSSIAQPLFGASSTPNPNPISYSLTSVHDASGCAATSFVEVTVSGANAGIDGCGPRFIGTPDQSGGLATYSWTVVSGDVGSLTTPNIPQPIVNPSANTIYELSILLNGITCTDQVFVTANCGCPAFNLSADSDVNCAIGDSTQNTTLSSDFRDTANYLFSWSPTTDLSTSNSPSTSITGSFSTNRIYTLTITNKFDPAITCSQNIQVLGANTALPQVNLSDTIGCLGVGIEIGFPPVAGRSYQWFPSTNLSDGNISNPIATLNYSRLYILEVTDNSTGCTNQDTLFAAVRAVGADAGDDAEFCDGAIVSLGTPALLNRTYDWQPANALGAPTAAQPTDTIFITTDYYLTVTDTLSGCIERDTITFTEKTAPMADAGVDSVAICQGGGILIGTPAVPGVNYAWLPTTGLSDPTIAQPIASPASTTTYQLITSIDGIGCYAVDEIKVEVSPTNAPSVNAGNNQSLCLGNSITIGLLGNASYTYAWSPATGLNDSSLAQPTATPIDTTLYTLVVTDPLTGCISIDEVTLFVGALPTVDAGSDELACADDFITIGPYSSEPGYVYSWSPTIGLDDPNDNFVYVEDLSPNSNILYTLMVTDAAGCTASDTVRVVIRSAPVADAGLDTSTCSSVQIGTPAISGNSYSWSPSDGLNSSSLAQPTATINTTTTYVLRVYDSNFCSARDTVIVTPTVIANAGNDRMICSGGSVMIGTSARSGTNYVWSPNTGLDNANIAEPVANPATTTTYIVSATRNGCVRMDTVTVTVVTPTIDLGADLIVCNGSCTNIGIPSAIGKIYQWSPNTGLNMPNQGTTTVCPTATTIYTLVETDIVMGCVATDEIVVEVNSATPPIINAGEDTVVCPGNTLTIGGSSMPNYNYTWSPALGLNDPYISNPITSPSATTTYVVTVVDNSTGCFNTDTITVAIASIPTVPTLNDITICTGSTSLIGLSVNDDYVYNWTPTTGLNNSMISNPIASPSATTTYQVQVTDTISGCTNSESLTVTVATSATPVIADAGDDIEVCIGEVVTLGSTNTTSGASYTWSPDALLSSGTVSQPTKTIPTYWTTGLYQLTVSMGACTSIDEVLVTAKPEIIIEAGADEIICGTTTTLAAQSTSVTNEWSFVSGPNTPIFGAINSASSSLSGLIPGVYTLRWNVSGNNICNSGYDQVQITVGALPELILNDPAIACPTVDLTAPSVTSGSTLHGALLSYWIDSTRTLPVGNPTDVGFSGQYFIQARTNLGCEAIEDVNVSIDCNNIFLPIEFFDFRARLQGKNTAFLDWKTLTDASLLGFEIEHALPSVSIPIFNKIAFVGREIGVDYYTHDVPDLVAGTHYFRLKQLEANGQYIYSQIRAVSIDKKLAKILLYPNPTNSNATIELSEMPLGNIEVEVMNALGQTLFSQTYVNKQFITLDLEQLVSASYMIRVKFENRVQVFKLIKK